MEHEKQRDKALQEVLGRLKTGEFQVGLRELSRYLPPPKLRFVTLTDLECLDLWLQLAGRIDPKPSEFQARAARLRDLAVRYIGQFSVTVREPEVQHLALELLDTIQHSQGPSVAITAAA